MILKPLLSMELYPIQSFIMLTVTSAKPWASSMGASLIDASGPVTIVPLPVVEPFMFTVLNFVVSILYDEPDASTSRAFVHVRETLALPPGPLAWESV